MESAWLEVGGWVGAEVEKREIERSAGSVTAGAGAGAVVEVLAGEETVGGWEGGVGMEGEGRKNW